MATQSSKNPQSSRAEHAYQQLLNAILSGELKPGSRIREVELAEWLKISRTPVREAVRRLESEGLICLVGHKGMAVAELDYQAVIELYQMREVLEAAAASLAAKHASEPEIYSLREIFNQEKQQDGNVATQAEINRAFHNAIYHAAHNRYLLKSLSSLRDAMALLGSTTYTLPSRSEAALAEHQRIVEAIEKGDSAGAEQAARDHIRQAQQARIRILTGELSNQAISPEHNS
ncbi:MAG: GntR family transcriptional regulator [Oceanospirillales bacterium]|nr:GntR family transcriptional regulator [Oceanospirillales bacterium]MBR9888710.1 GntR family transcriptional regulator [Oceanospirillales bacterium]